VGGLSLPWLPNVRNVEHSDRRRRLDLGVLSTYSCGFDILDVLSGPSLPETSVGIGVEKAEPGRVNDGSVWPTYCPGWKCDPGMSVGSAPARVVDSGSERSCPESILEGLEGVAGGD